MPDRAAFSPFGNIPRRLLLLHLTVLLLDQLLLKSSCLFKVVLLFPHNVRVEDAQNLNLRKRRLSKVELGELVIKLKRAVIRCREFHHLRQL